MARKSNKIEVIGGTINVKDVEKEIKDDIRSDLYDEITNKINTESKKSLEKLEKRIIKYKNLSIIKRDLLILVFLIIIILETYIIISNNYSFKKIEINTSKNEAITDSDKNTDNDTTNTEVVKDDKWYIENYSYLLDNVKTNLLDNKYYLYADDYKEDTIDNAIKLNMAYQLLDSSKINNSDSVIKIKSSDLKDSYSKIFGSSNKYQNSNFYNDCIQFIYNEKSDTYMAIDTECTKDNSELIEQVQKIYEKNNDITIETIVGVLNTSDNTLYDISGKKVAANYKSEDLINYSKKLDKRIYIFEKSNDDYYLKEIKSGK